MKRYLPDIASLAADPDFVAWVHEKQISEDGRWNQLANGDEEQQARLRKAIEFVQHLDLAPTPVSYEQIDTDWQRLVLQQSSAAPVLHLPLTGNTAGRTSHKGKSLTPTKESRFRRPRPRKLLAIAATLLLLLTAGLAWTYLNNEADYHNDFAERSSVELDDGTIIDLQANSSLYVEEWTSQERILRLEGEAFFIVAHAPSRPFIVRAGQTKVTVLGTRFNVFNRNETPTIALEEGSISLQSAAALTTLVPGEVATINAGGEIRQEVEENISYHTSWRKGRWALEQTPLRDIAVRITANFGVQVHFKNTDFANKKLSGSLPADELNELIETLSRLLDHPISRLGETIVFE